MTKERFAELVRRLEEYARANPKGYALRVGLMAAVGYGYVLLVLLVVLGLLAGLVALMILAPKPATAKLAFKLGFALAVLAFVVLRALWVRLPAPTGVELERHAAPELFSLIDELRRALAAPRFHHVLLTDDFNAAVVQVPRLGILGWQRNYLILGLPLLEALSLEQFRAVAGHEFAHLSRNHSRFAGWIYRVRQTWSRLIEQLVAQQQWGAGLFTRFLKWYGPFFNAYSFALARANEYEADRCAAQLAGPRTIAEALINVSVYGKFLDETFWPAVFKQASHHPNPPPQALGLLSRAVRGGVKSQDARKWLRQALLTATHLGDTHPSLSDRLAALGCAAPPGAQGALAGSMSVPPPAAQSAAERLLGGTLEAVRGQLETGWIENIAPHWGARHEEAQEAQKRLVALEHKAQSGALSPEECWQRAQWTAEYRGDDAALPLLREILARDPREPGANFALGRILLAREQPEGVAHLEAAMRADEEAILPACELLYEYHRDQGQLEAARACEARAEEQLEQLALAEQERADATERDTFLPHALEALAVANLVTQLRRYQEVRTAHLVRKAVEHFPHKPFFVLLITTKVAWYKFRSEEADQKLLQRLLEEVELPGHTLVVVLGQHTAKLGKVIKKQPGSLIYDRRAATALGA